MIKTMTPVTNVDFPNLKLFKKGKVRSVYEWEDSLVIVASDRISAFDHILPTGIPNKGQTLTDVSAFWFSKLKDIIPNHMISIDVDEFPAPFQEYKDVLAGRSMWVKKTELIEIECVVRGYLVGSGWKEYQELGTVCGHKLPEGLQLADRLPEVIFTPAFKATNGHDENITIEKMAVLIGSDLTKYLIKKSMAIYEFGRDYAAKRGIILADTKFEFGLRDNQVILIDEVLTPDSSRFWPESSYTPGISPPSFDKQIVRDHLEASGWNKNPPVPTLPEQIVNETARQYAVVKELLLG
ncbi:MAG: phosphoribosylaminoimidazole-succinocarboxamide synthase [Candidatus Marinamargulisbacteria bacterium]|jgi:phosphoribosylaminoimidazole-succinocarboxamide synthase